MNKILAVGLGLLVTSGLGYCLYKCISQKNSAPKTADNVNAATETVNDVVVASEEQEVDMSTNRAAYYAAVKDVKEIDLEPMAEAVDDFLQLLEAVKEGSQYEGKFYIRKFNYVGFITHTRYGNVVVWNNLGSDDDQFDFYAPSRVLSLLPQIPSENFKHYLTIGDAIESIIGIPA